MLKGEYLIVKAGYLREYATKRFNAQKNLDSVDFRDFSANRFERAVENSQNIYGFDGISATIRIEGPLSVEGPDVYDLYCGLGGCSYLNISDSALKAASDVNPELGKVFVKMNTPGGTVDGCDATFQAIWALSLTHEVIVENMGLIASAGVWLSSAATKVIAKTPVALSGSIGVVVNTYDFTGMLENMGIEQIVITNFESPDKIPDLKTEKGVSVVREELDAIFNIFRQRFIQGRDRAMGKGKVTIEDVNAMTGRVFTAEKSLELGLLDELEDSSSVVSGSESGKIINKDLKIKTEVEKNESEVNQEGEAMKLSQFLKENPDAQVEFDGSISAAKKEGADSIKAVIAAAVPIMESDAYPAAVKKLAIKAIMGETDIVAMTVAVTMHDASSEKVKSEATEKEGKKQVETPPTSDSDQENKQGKVETIEDYAASVNNLRAIQGLPPLDANKGGV